MRLGKNLTVWLIALGAVVFTASAVRAGGVVEEWVARYNGPANSYDVATAIAVDGSGNIYVTGQSPGSGTANDYATIKYNSDGNELWFRRYNGPGNSGDGATAIAVDGSGNIYVTGSSTGSGTYADYATIKYDSNGTQLWVARYNGPGNDYDTATAIAVDGSGNIYVTGSSSGGPSTYADYATIKYNSDGNEIWVRRYNGPLSSGDQAYAIALDNSGNIYVTGYSYGSASDRDYATIKYNSAGTQLWVARYNGPGNGGDEARAVALDSSGNIYVTGKSYSFDLKYDYATIKYEPNGTQKWIARYNGPGNNDDGATAIAADGSGNIYVTGSSTGSTTSTDYATIKYDSAGNELWVHRYNGPGSSGDGATAITVDSSGYIYVTGSSNGSTTGTDYATIKYDSASIELWTRRYNGPTNGYDGATAIAVDGSDNIYVTGSSTGSTTGTDYATIRYTQIPAILTMQTEPAEVNTVTPLPGDHGYALGIVVNISAQEFVNCPDVYTFDYWDGDVNDPNSASTTVVMDTDKTITAVFVSNRQCGDECHPYPVGDLDKDCEVTFADFALFAAHWLECTKPECD